MLILSELKSVIAEIFGVFLTLKCYYLGNKNGDLQLGQSHTLSSLSKTDITENPQKWIWPSFLLKPSGRFVQQN